MRKGKSQTSNRGASRGAERGVARKDRTKSDPSRSNSGGGSILSGEVTWYKPRKGVNALDIIGYETTSGNTHPCSPESDPFTKGELFYKRPVKVHYEVGPGKRKIVCPTSINKKCPICEEHAALLRDRNIDDDEIKHLKPKNRDLFNVIDLDDTDKGVQVWDFSNYCFGEPLRDDLDEFDDEDDRHQFYSIFGGSTLEINLKEKTFSGNKFLTCKRIDFVERDDYAIDILDDVVNFDERLIILPYEDIERIHLGIDSEDDVQENAPDEEEEESRQRKPKQTTSSRKQREKESKPESESDVNDNNDDENLCPEGGEFGVDNQNFDGCDNCAIWDACIEENGRLKREKRQKPQTKEKDTKSSPTKRGRSSRRGK